MSKTSRLFKFKEAADQLGVEVSTLRKWRQLRKIEVVVVSPRAVRISSDEIDRIIKSGTVRSISSV
ncbi:MAG: helix-turn-helix domain-containing protein [Nitrospiria bacterium]